MEIAEAGTPHPFFPWILREPEAWVEREEVSGALITEFILEEAVGLRDLPPTPLKPARVNTASDSSLGAQKKGAERKNCQADAQRPQSLRNALSRLPSPLHRWGE